MIEIRTLLKKKPKWPDNVKKLAGTHPTFKPYVLQECKSRQRARQWKVESESRPGLYFDVEYEPRGDGKPPNWSCSCEAFQYRSILTDMCKHCKGKKETLCRWSSAVGPEQQNKKQARGRQCPRCGGETKKKLGKKSLKSIKLNLKG